MQLDGIPQLSSLIEYNTIYDHVAIYLPGNEMQVALEVVSEFEFAGTGVFVMVGNGGRGEFSHDDTTDIYTLKNADGSGATFYGFTWDYREGLAKTITLGTGESATVNWTQASGALAYHLQSVTWNSGASSEVYEPSYDDRYFLDHSRVDGLTQKRNGATVRSTEIELYPDLSIENPGTPNSPNDNLIKYLRIRNGGPSSPVIETQYYRWTQGGLKLWLSDANLRRWIHDNPTEQIEDATDASLIPYADNYFEYWGDGRVKKEVAAGGGRGTTETNESGHGIFTFDYVENDDTTLTGRNAWATKTTEKVLRWDSGVVYQNIVYTNAWGQAILEIRKEGASGSEYLTWHRYDGRGREIVTAHNSAFKNQSVRYDEDFADLVHHPSNPSLNKLETNSGLVEITRYYTGASGEPSGQPTDYRWYTAVTEGEKLTSQGAVDHSQDKKIREWTYLDGDTNNGGVADDDIWFVSTETEYPDSDNYSEKYVTSFEYEFDGVHIQEKLTKHPKIIGTSNIATTQNGADSSSEGSSSNYTLQEYFDDRGQLVWTKDGSGYLKYFEYDILTGAMTKQIIDAAPSSMTTVPTADRPTRDSTLPTALGLTTTWVVDTQGRPLTTTDPNGNVTKTRYDDTIDDNGSGTIGDTVGGVADDPIEVRIYRGWTGSTTTGPITAIVTDSRTGLSDIVTYTVSGSLPTDSDGPTGTESLATATIRSLRRERMNVSKQVLKVNNYFALPSGSYISNGALVSGFGTEGTHYFTNQTAYDSQGMEYKTIDPDGTVRFKLHNGRGLLVSEWLGTNGTGATEANPQATSPNNIKQVGESAYDGNGNLLSSKQFYGDSTGQFYQTDYKYDFRNRMIATRLPDGVATGFTLDNLGRQKITETFADANNNLVVNTNELRGKSVSSFDPQGRVYRTEAFEVDPSSGSLGDKLATNFWYDLRGNLIKTSNANQLMSKSTFDGAGRVTAQYLSYQKDSLGNDTDTLFADADDVTGDLVIEQRTTIYDAGSRPTLVTTYERTSDSPTNLALGAHNSFIQVQGTWYDSADRVKARANYGRDLAGAVYNTTTGALVGSGGIPTIISNGVPAIPTSDTSYSYIISKVEYDDAGRVYRVGDNKSVESGGALSSGFNEFTHDLLGRRTKMVENYVNGTAAETETDTDRTTEWIYDSSGRLSIQRAKNPLGSGNNVENQDTTLLYGSTIDASWPTSTIYPDSNDTTSAGTDQVKTEYDRLGRVTKLTDQRGVVHDYLYDTAGRLEVDKATSLGGSGSVDATIRRIERAYDDMSRLQTITSYDAVTVGNIKDQVKHTFDGWGNVIKSQQSHSGAVGTGTPAVEYIYDDAGTGSGSAKYVRPEKIKYPNGREIKYGYGTLTSIDNVLSRVRTIADVNPSTTHTTYNYIGAGRLMSEDRANFVSKGFDDLSTTSNIDGIDTFGRTTIIHWGGVGDIYNDVSTYTYDRNSNRLSKGVNADGMSDIYQDESYTYDGLDRLASFDREGTFTQNWSGVSGATLDALGNWRSQITDTNGAVSGGATTQTRIHNKANETGAISGNTPTWVTPAHDANGNMTAMPKPGSESTQIDAKYDAWNRMVEAKESSTVTGTYRYDGLNRRIFKTVGSTTEHAYFSENYQVLEVRKNSDTTPLEQNIWGTQYVDELIVRDRDSSPDDGSLDTSFSGDGLVTTDFGADDYGQRLAIQSDGKILVAGYTTYYDEEIEDYMTDIAVVRYRPDGTLDSSFGDSGKRTYPYFSGSVHQLAISYAIKVLANGDILVAGRTSGDTLLLKLESDGDKITTWGTSGWVKRNFGFSDGAFDMEIDAGGKILVAGYQNSGDQWMIARFNADGTIDNSFDSDGEANVSWSTTTANKAYDLEIQSNGKIVIAGTADSKPAIARLNTDGSMDTTFGTGGKESYSGIGLTAGFMGLAIDDDGKFVAVGYASDPATVFDWDSLTARINSAGGLDTLFSSDGYDIYDTAGAFNIAGGVSIQPDDKIVVSSTVGTGNAMLLRYTTGGALDTTFDSDGVVETNIATGTSDTWVGIGHTWDGKIVVSGYANGDFAAGRYFSGVGLDQRLYVQQDANWNVTSVSNSFGATVERYRYTPYGQRTVLNDDFTVNANSTTSDYTFNVGHQGLLHDAETNLIYNRARYLHNTLGRFTAEDPLGTAYQDGMNLYEYVRSNPTGFTDPGGKESLDSKFNKAFGLRVVGGLATLTLANYTYDTRMFYDDDKEMQGQLDGSIKSFYARMAQNSGVGCEWTRVSFASTNAAELTKGGIWIVSGPKFSFGFWLARSAAVFAEGSLMARQIKGDTYQVKDVYVQWDWQDDVDANSFTEMKGDKNKGLGVWALEGLWNWVGDGLLNTSFNVSVAWLDDRTKAFKVGITD